MNRKSILIADDDEDIVASLSKRCTHMGLKVATALTAFDALMSIRTSLPDVVCLDVNMPAGDGLSICQMLMSDQDSLNLPVIILTGKKDAATLRRCQELKARYVAKGGDVWGELEPLLREILTMPIASPETILPPVHQRVATCASLAAVSHFVETPEFSNTESH
jgi:CheY-like chemotaxis protein